VESWICVREGKMLETSEGKVAIFRTPRAAARWIEAVQAAPHAKPARVIDLVGLVSSRRTEHIVNSAADDREQAMVDDPAFAAFAIREKEEKASKDLAMKALEATRRAANELVDLRDRERRALEETEKSEVILSDLEDECQELEDMMTELRASIDSARRGKDLLTSATRLAQIGHPAAAMSADPKRLAQAAVYFLKQDEARAAHLERVTLIVNEARVADAEAVIKEAKRAEERRLQEAKKLVAAQKEAAAAQRKKEQEAAAQRKREAAAAPLEEPQQLLPEAPPEDDSDDSDDDEDLEILRELETELQAAGVRKHAKVARKIYDQELSWSQLSELYRNGGSANLHRTLTHVGLTMGAVAAIDLRFAKQAALVKEKAAIVEEEAQSESTSPSEKKNKD